MCNMCNTIQPHVNQWNRCGSSNRGYWLNGVPEVAMVTDITRTVSNGLECFLVLKKGEEAVGMVISLTGLAGIAMVTGIKD